MLCYSDSQSLDVVIESVAVLIWFDRYDWRAANLKSSSTYMHNMTLNMSGTTKNRY